MKKILKILGIIIALLIVLVLALPFLFKGKIFDMVQEEANKNLNAEVKIESLDLSIIENFPDFSLTISKTSVKGVDEFKGVTLADVGEVYASVDVMSVISGDQLKINSFGIENADFHVIVTKDGKANWDVMKTSDTAAETEEPADSGSDQQAETEESGTFNINVNEYYLRNINVIYDDREGDMYAKIDSLTHEGKGDFDLEQFLFETKTTIKSITYAMDGTEYMKDVSAEAIFNFEMDMPNSKYTFKENSVSLNDLTLGFDGWVQMPEDDIDMDLSFESKETSFKSLLSLVPNAYTADFKDVETSGTLSIVGNAKGTYASTEESMSLPGFDAELIVNNARFQYPDLPKSAENIEIDVRASNPGGSEDNTVIDVNRFHVELAENPIDLSLHLKTPISDPDVKGDFKAQVDMASIQDVIPTEEGEKYTGTVTSDIHFDGKMSAIEEERYGDFKAEGKLIILDFLYSSPAFSYPVKLQKMYMDFSPQYVDLTTFEAMAGKTDISAKGKIDNMLGYYFNDEVLTGNFNLFSNYMNITELMDEGEGSESEETEETEESQSEPADTAAMEVVPVPGNIDFTMDAKIKELIYDNINMKNVKGEVVIANEAIDMTDLYMELLDGNMTMSGSYATTNPKSPDIDFAMDISRFDLEKTAATFNTFEKLAPIIESAKGKFSTNMTMKGKLLENMDVDLNSLNGGGKLQTHKVTIDNKALEKLDKTLKSDKFNPLEASDLNISFTFKDGKVTTEPFELEAGGINNTISGYTTFEQRMDYTIDSEVPSSILGGKVNDLAGDLMGKLKNSGVDLGSGLPETIEVSFKVTGDVTDPDVKPTFKGGKGTASSVKEQVKDKVKEEIEKKKEEVKEDVKERANEIMKDAREKADQIRSEAKKQADKVRAQGKKAAQRIREEAAKKAQDLIDEASNPLAKAGAKKAAEKINNEADKKAKQTEQEANKRAQQIEDEADKRAQQVIDKAQQQVDEL